jgi:hypothetical protein
MVGAHTVGLDIGTRNQCLKILIDAIVTCSLVITVVTYYVLVRLSL